MAAFLAHYRSLDSSSKRALGMFEFESNARLASKANMHDARVRMLELYGNEALSWNIEKVERKRQASEHQDGQLELDFRDPVKKRKRKQKKEYW